MQFSKVILSLGLALACLSGAAQDRVLTVGTGSTFRPFGYLTPDNKHVGFDIDVITAIAEAGKFKINIVISETLPLGLFLAVALMAAPFRRGAETAAPVGGGHVVSSLIREKSNTLSLALCL